MELFVFLANQMHVGIMLVLILMANIQKGMYIYIYIRTVLTIFVGYMKLQLNHNLCIFT